MLDLCVIFIVLFELLGNYLYELITILSFWNQFISSLCLKLKIFYWSSPFCHLNKCTVSVSVRSSVWRQKPFPVSFSGKIICFSGLVSGKSRYFPHMNFWKSLENQGWESVGDHAIYMAYNIVGHEWYNFAISVVQLRQFLYEAGINRVAKLYIRRSRIWIYFI